MPKMTMVRIGGGSPPNVDDGSSKPSNKGQPNGSDHSTGHASKGHENLLIWNGQKWALDWWGVEENLLSNWLQQ